MQKVSNSRLIETPFRAPQLTLWSIGPDEWVLYWRMPDTAPARRKRRVQGLVQPLLFDSLPEEKVVGGNETGSATSLHGRLRVIPRQNENQEPEE